MGFANENGTVSSSVGSLWRGRMKKGYDDKLMPLVKNKHKKFTHNENLKSTVFERMNTAASHLIRYLYKTVMQITCLLNSNLDIFFNNPTLSFPQRN